jgi:hypothetical protein
MDIEVDGGGSFEVGRWQASVVELPVGSLIAGRLNTRAKQSKSRAEQNRTVGQHFSLARGFQAARGAMLYLCVKWLSSAIDQTKQRAIPIVFHRQGQIDDPIVRGGDRREGSVSTQRSYLRICFDTLFEALRNRSMRRRDGLPTKHSTSYACWSPPSVLDRVEVARLHSSGTVSNSCF